MTELIQKVEDSLSSIFSKEDVLNLLKSYEAPTHASYMAFHDNINHNALDEAKINYKLYNEHIYEVTAHSMEALIEAVSFIETQNKIAQLCELTNYIGENTEDLMSCFEYNDNAFELSLYGNTIEVALKYEKVTPNFDSIEDFLSEI